MAKSNQRHFSRRDEEATVQVFITPDDSTDPIDGDDSIPAKMYNQNEGGLYIEIDRALQPGSKVSIKMVAPEENHLEVAYYLDDGRVIWCKKVDDETSRFGVGVKILRSVVRANFLTYRLG